MKGGTGGKKVRRLSEFDDEETHSRRPVKKAVFTERLDVQKYSSARHRL